jgi:pimeloyl-ACP methyl ester carboxylesterase
MVAWDRVTRADVLHAIKEYDRLGPEQFFSEHGFAPTTTYELAWEKRRYPPKAILGTAYEFATGQRLGSSDFEGREDRRRKGARTAGIHCPGEATTSQVKRLFVMNQALGGQMTKIAYRRIAVDSIEIFYREAGRSNAPALLLLHGFPTASHMFRDLIPELADRFHVIAPDLPGFGQSDMPERTKFSYTFDNIAGAIDRFTEVIGLDRFAIYVFDYGAPTGFRLAVRHPERITAIISQNGNAYVEGLSDGWNPIRAYWQDPSEANRTALRAFLSPETTVWQYTHGVADTSSVSPDGYSLDNFYLARPGADEVQLDLFGDYKSNVALYPEFQAYFRKHKPPFLAVWGKKDPFFLPAGAEAFKRDIPNADVRFFDTGHFALETHCDEIAAAIRQFLDHRQVN